MKNTPVLRHLVQDFSKLTKKQAEKFSHHLGKIDLNKVIDKFAMKMALKSVKKNTIIAYDLTDIAKEYSEKIEKITRVFEAASAKLRMGFCSMG